MGIGDPRPYRPTTQWLRWCRCRTDLELLTIQEQGLSACVSHKAVYRSWCRAYFLFWPMPESERPSANPPILGAAARVRRRRALLFFCGDRMILHSRHSQPIWPQTETWPTQTSPALRQLVDVKGPTSVLGHPEAREVRHLFGRASL